MKDYGTDKDKEKQKVNPKKAFQLVSPGQKKPLVLQAETEEERQEWVEKLLESISLSLDQAEDLKSITEEDEVMMVSLFLSCSSLSLCLSLGI